MEYASSGISFLSADSVSDFQQYLSSAPKHAADLWSFTGRNAPPHWLLGITEQPNFLGL
jgi:hypothetical protein